ncbi:MAG: 50S ribosomal protein L4, partial [Patescibacteria group bacterium]
MKAPLYNQNGEKKGDVTLAAHLFEIKAGEGLVHLYLNYQRTNQRQTISNTLSKGEVRGGGKKPWRQKGTGRARQGSIRNPHWKGGGVAFGPKKEANFEKMMPKQMRRAALFAILSSKAKDGKIIALDKFELEKPKSKTFAELIKKLSVNRDVLVVGGREEDMLKKSVRNLENAKIVLPTYLNPHDLLKYEHLLFTEAALKQFESTYKA